MALAHGQPLPTDPDQLDGVIKAAIVLLCLDHDVAGELLKQISDMVKQNPDEVANLLRRWIRVEG